MNDETPEVALEPEAGMPFLTVLSSLAVLVLFAVVGMILYRQLEKELAESQEAPAELALKLMKDAQEKRLSSFGFDNATNTGYMPITSAMERLAKEKAK
jgi:hypothetical protein